MELDIEDPDALAELLILNAEHVPTIVVGDVIVTGEDAINEEKLRSILVPKLKG